MALDQSALLEVLEVLKAAEVDDRIRQAAKTIDQALIEAELSSVLGALPHERTGARTGHVTGTGRGRSPRQRRGWTASADRSGDAARAGGKLVAAGRGGCDNRLVRRGDITAGLVSRLVGTQFPRWAGLPVRPVQAGGVDNVTFRLGEELAVRLPSGPEYVPGVVKEQRWLPVLAAQLPLPIPELMAVGEPGCGFPWPWSVYRWIDGGPLTDQMAGDLPWLAADLAEFLAALYRIDPVGGPPPGPHNFFRGGPLTVYEGETQEALAALAGHIDTALAAEVWQAAMAAPGPGRPVWFHGDAQPGNLLTKDGRLCAVIDFGTCGVGDPACDTTIAWTFLSGESSRVFTERLPVDQATWTRGRGWAIWKAMKVLVGALDHDPQDAAFTTGVIGKVLADHLANT